MEAVRIEDFTLRKTYHTPPEYPGNDIKIPPQHWVSDPLKKLKIVGFSKG